MGIALPDLLPPLPTRTECPVPAPLPAYMRSHGKVDIAFASAPHGLVLARDYQAGNLQVRLSRGEPLPVAVLINTAGGIAEGDSLDQRFAWQAGAAAVVTTQAAEKVYRAPAHPALIVNRLSVASGAVAEWLPQETILFDGFTLHRDTTIDLSEDAHFLALEALVLGRGASGEIVRTGALTDRIRIRRGGRLVYADALTLGGDLAARPDGDTIDTHMDRVAGGARAMAVIVLASADASRLLGPVRAALGDARGRVAASSWNGLLAVRLLAPDGETLRHDIALALAPLRAGRPLPRVWRC